MMLTRLLAFLVCQAVASENLGGENCMLQGGASLARAAEKSSFAQLVEDAGAALAEKYKGEDETGEATIVAEFPVKLAGGDPQQTFVALMDRIENCGAAKVSLQNVLSDGLNGSAPLSAAATTTTTTTVGVQFLGYRTYNFHYSHSLSTKESYMNSTCNSAFAGSRAATVFDVMNASMGGGYAVSVPMVFRTYGTGAANLQAYRYSSDMRCVHGNNNIPRALPTTSSSVSVTGGTWYSCSRRRSSSSETHSFACVRDSHR